MLVMKLALVTVCLIVLTGVSGGSKKQLKKMPKGEYLRQDVEDVKYWRLLDMAIAIKINDKDIPPYPYFFPIDRIESVGMLQWVDKKWYIIKYTVKRTDGQSECTAQFSTPNVRDDEVVMDEVKIYDFGCISRIGK